MSRVVAIGDLNGAQDVLADILKGLRLVDARGAWVGGKAQLIQVGDIFNRGPAAKAALEWLLKLKGEARRSGGGVTVLLGNHEVMVATRHEAYCTIEEYLSFATQEELRQWHSKLEGATWRLYTQHPRGGPILPLAPRLEMWKLNNVPGKAEFRDELGPSGKLGKAIRKLPIACRFGDEVFVHAGLTPEWAKLGIDELNRLARTQWNAAPRFFGRLPADSLLRDPDGPLWDRSLVAARKGTRARVRESLRQLSCQRMVIGHTQTRTVPGGSEGHIKLVQGGRMVLIDVGLRAGSNTPRVALVIEGRRGYEWNGGRKRLLWDDR